MFILRLVVVIAAIAIGASILAYLISHDPRYLSLAWRLSKWSLAFALFMFALFVIERVLAPVVPLV